MHEGYQRELRRMLQMRTVRRLRIQSLVLSLIGFAVLVFYPCVLGRCTAAMFAETGNLALAFFFILWGNNLSVTANRIEREID